MTKYSPLTEDKELVKELELAPEAELPTDQKLAFLQAQITELKSMAWRERVNVLHALRLQRDKNEVMRMKGQTNIVEHKNALRQYTGGIKTLNALIEELEAEA